MLGEGEWAAFNAPRAVLNGYVKKQGAHAVDYREVVYDTRLASSYSTFGRSFDLFGDGSVRLVFTPGHSVGHQSLVVRLKDREAARQEVGDSFDRLLGGLRRTGA